MHFNSNRCTISDNNVFIKQQKLVTGDDSGSVGCYEFKKGAPQTVFLSQPFDGPISCVAIGGNPQKKDKVLHVFCFLTLFIAPVFSLA